MARTATILLVEDDANDALLVRKAAQKTLAGIPMQIVPNGQEALNYLSGQGIYADRAQHPFPDIVLLDLKMPVMNGFELLRWVRAQPKFRCLPVIILTGSVHESDTNMAYEEGANSYLIKPGNFNDLVETMKNVGDFWLTGTRLPSMGD